MAIYKKKVFPAVLLFTLAAALSLTGCSGKKASEQIVASINDYKMTAEDFKYESKEILSTAKLFVGAPVTKEDVLDALVTKELLLQEAQKRDLDKDINFMRTIELYWEQTLIKNLLTQKSKQIKEAIAVYEDEVRDYYNKMKNDIRAKVLVLADEKAGRRLLIFEGDVSGYAEKEPERSSLLYTFPSRVYVLGETGSSLENSIFNIDEGKSRGLAAINGNWALIIIEERIPAEVGSFFDARDNITESIKLIKEKELVNDWIDKLRSDARIKINRKVLSELR